MQGLSLDGLLCSNHVLSIVARHINMNKSQTFVVDFIVKSDPPGLIKLVLVEEGDWSDIDVRLRSLQKRMYGCIDAIIDGQLVNQFPGVWKKDVIISVDFYDAPHKETYEFFKRFSENVLLIPSYEESIRQSDFVDNISFEANFETLAKK